jgi:hypothetical protein
MKPISSFLLLESSQSVGSLLDRCSADIGGLHLPRLRGTPQNSGALRRPAASDALDPM